MPLAKINMPVGRMLVCNLSCVTFSAYWKIEELKEHEERKNSRN
jgi:hypothetical protein